MNRKIEIKDIFEMERGIELESETPWMKKLCEVSPNWNEEITLARNILINQLNQYKKRIQEIENERLFFVNRMKESYKDSLDGSKILAELDKDRREREQHINMLHQQANVDYIPYQNILHKAYSYYSKVISESENKKVLDQKYEDEKNYQKKWQKSNQFFILKMLSSPVAKASFVALFLGCVIALSVLAAATSGISLAAGLSIGLVGLFSGAAAFVPKPNPHPWLYNRTMNDPASGSITLGSRL